MSSQRHCNSTIGPITRPFPTFPNLCSEANAKADGNANMPRGQDQVPESISHAPETYCVTTAQHSGVTIAKICVESVKARRITRIYGFQATHMPGRQNLCLPISGRFSAAVSFPFKDRHTELRLNNATGVSRHIFRIRPIDPSLSNRRDQAVALIRQPPACSTWNRQAVFR
jgi:hypothetical protein